MNMNVLTIEGLRAGYGGRSVAHLPQLSLTAGEACLLRGASGSGKTTLLYAIAGFGGVLGGSVRVGNMDPYSLTESARDRWRGDQIGIVFQTLNLVKSLSVMENVLLGAFVSGRAQDAARAGELLERLGIADLRHKSAARISQGQAQRVAIARALLNRPALLLADEPTSSLDHAAAVAAMDLLTSLCRESGAALVVATHDERIGHGFDHQITLGGAAWRV